MGLAFVPRLLPRRPARGIGPHHTYWVGGPVTPEPADPPPEPFGERTADQPAPFTTRGMGCCANNESAVYR
jgi:hypothetical protein